MINQGRLGRVARWLGWAILWCVYHPELLSRSFQFSSLDEFIRLILWYFGLGLLLEYFYIRLVRSKDGNREGLIPDIEAPDCPEHPWIPLVNQPPPENTFLEFYCADGKSRSAKVLGRVEGRLVFEILYETYIAKKQRRNPMRFCPTHWRHLRSETRAKEREVNDVF